MSRRPTPNGIRELAPHELCRIRLFKWRFKVHLQGGRREAWEAFVRALIDTADHNLGPIAGRPGYGAWAALQRRRCHPQETTT